MSGDIDVNVPVVGQRTAAAGQRSRVRVVWRLLPGWRVGATGFGLIRMSLLAFSVRVVAGIGACVFRELIGFVDNVSLLGIFAFDDQARDVTGRIQ